MSARRARQARRSATIHAYVGENGGGKTLAAVHDTIPSLLAGRRVAGTVLILDPGVMATCEAEADEAWSALGIVERPTRPLAMPHPLWSPIRTWSDLLDRSDCDLLLDEVQGVINSRAHQALPAAVLTSIQQMRRADNAVRWMTPAYARADVALREVTQAVTYCIGFRRERQRPCKAGCEVEHEHETVKLWGANRLFRWRTYNATDFDEFTSAHLASQQRKEKLRSLAKQWYRRRGGDATAYYDTLAPILNIRDVTEAGSCLRCGGTRRRPQCKCAPAESSHAQPSVPVPATARRAP